MGNEREQQVEGLFQELDSCSERLVAILRELEELHEPLQDSPRRLFKGSIADLINAIRTEVRAIKAFK